MMKTRTKSLVTLLIAFLIFLSYIYIDKFDSVKVFKKASVITKQETKQEAKQETKQETKHILFWTDFYGKPYWDMKNETYGKKELESIHCPVTNCIITHKKDYLKNVSDYAALIFHAGMTGHFDNSMLPKIRNPRQLFIMATKEYIRFLA